eukprot:5793690-Pyramimonas_sp.AAC.1
MLTLPAAVVGASAGLRTFLQDFAREEFLPRCSREFAAAAAAAAAHPEALALPPGAGRGRG